jgi:predicted ATP-grasp superfamily ATP-dependent carboligase
MGFVNTLESDICDLETIWGVGCVQRIELSPALMQELSKSLQEFSKHTSTGVIETLRGIPVLLNEHEEYSIYFKSNRRRRVDDEVH